MKNWKKRGLSTIIVTLILIGLSLVAIGIFWVIIRDMINRQASGISLEKLTVSMDIENVYSPGGNNISVQVKRNTGKGEIIGIKFIFYNETDNEVFSGNTSLKELEIKTFTFILNMNVTEIEKVSIAPIFKSNSEPGNIADTYEITEMTFAACIPSNCSFLGYQCGTWANGTCGGTLNCGTCGAESDCVNGICVLKVDFIPPTPSDASSQSATSVYVNVSTNYLNEHSAWIDWNRSLIGWWNFENVSAEGIIYDGSDYNRNGLLYNHSTNTTVAGIRGSALEFDGLGDYINLSNIGAREWTISAWFRLNEIRSGSDVHTIMSKWEDSSGTKVNYHFDIRIGRLRAIVSNSSGIQGAALVAGNTLLNVGQWYHGVATFNGAILRVYLNGVLDNQTDTRFYYSYTGTKSAAIGSFSFPWSSYKDEFNGTLDEVMIFGRALTQEEIRALYQTGTYRLYNNFTNLGIGSYTYQAYAIDTTGSIGKTGTRSITIL